MKYTGSAILTTILLSGSVSGQDASIRVDVSKVENRISPLIYGSCMEDVNHEVYGGLYGQRIFGEGFEEPPRGLNLEGFKRYGGLWDLDGNRVNVQSDPGAKLVSEISAPENGSIEVDIKFTGVVGENAGLLFYVVNPGNGAYNFEGYDVSLSQNGKKVRLGKHHFNRTTLAEAGVTFDRFQWTHLKVQLDGAFIKVYINYQEKPAIVYTDTNSPFSSGKIGLHTWNADVSFRNLKVEQSKILTAIPFKVKEMPEVSLMWDTINTENCHVAYSLDTSTPFSGKNSQIIHYKSGIGKVGIANRGLNRWGIAVEDGQEFQGRIYLKGEDVKGKITVALQSADGSKTYANQDLTGITDDWKKYSFTLTSSAKDEKARFAILMESPGKLWVDQVMLMETGKKLFNGLPYRADIGNAMVSEGLAFLRYGGTMINAAGYRFKKMIGDADHRPPYTGHYYRYASNGFGIEDFLKFCEAAHFTPAFAINIEETAQDAADMVEYLNGAVTTTWGKKRAENGHPEPYNVRYIEIGNEEAIFNGDSREDYLHYIDRFEDLYNAIHGKDTSIGLIISAWWRPESPNMKMVFDRLNDKAAYWDYHPGADAADAGLNTDKELTEMEKLFLQWSHDTKLKITIFEENGGLHNMQRALGHATTLNAVRRHSSWVLTSCPANALQPYKQNDNGWDQGQIFFTPTQVWGMPPFYVQQMAARNQLPLRVCDITSGKLDVTAARSEDGSVLSIHVVNYTDEPVNTRIELTNFRSGTTVVNIESLSGKLSDENTPENPEEIKPAETTLTISGNTFIYTFPAFSYTILKLGR